MSILAEYETGKKESFVFLTFSAHAVGHASSEAFYD